MRAVIDTNVLVSALFSRRGAANHVFSAAADGAFVVLAPPPLFLEYEEVLKRPEHRLRHGPDLGQVDTLLRSLATITEPVDVRFVWRPQLRDPDDEMVLEAAINGSADVIATYNVAGFGAAVRFGLRIAAPQDFLKEIAR
jgi:putative PIN family toxin of toxin-antitoxin system